MTKSIKLALLVLLMGATQARAVTTVTRSNDDYPRVVQQGGTAVSTYHLNMATGLNVTNSAYIQAYSSTSDDIGGMYVVNSSTGTIQLAVGASGSEVAKLLIGPSMSGYMPLAIAGGSRIAIKSIDASISSGVLDISFVK